MNFEWDENKNQLNILKHGITFEEAAAVLSGVCLTRNAPGNFGESRSISVGVLRDVVIVVIFTVRLSNVRIISSRRANKSERMRYYEHFKEKN